MNDKNDPIDGKSEGFTFRRREFLALLTGSIAVAAFAGPSTLLAQVKKNGGILRVGYSANPSSLDPATGGAGSDHVCMYPVFDTLVNWNYDTLEAKPGLAKSWDFPDPKTLVLELEEGVTFHDGERFDAEAVKFNFERNMTDPRSNIKSDVSSVDRVEVTGEYQVTIHLKEPDTSLPLVLSDRAGMMVSPKAARELGSRHDREPVGTGPMKLVSWHDGSELVYTRYEGYWRKDRPLLDGIEIKIITDSSTRLRSVMSGQTDVAERMDGRQLPMIKRSGNIEGHIGPTVYCYQLYVNHSRGAMKNLKVRQALNYAIDREALVKATMSGAGEPAYMNLPSRHWAYDEDVAKLYSYNPEKARALLVEAGYPDGVELDMRGYSDQGSVQRQEVLLSMLHAVGFKGRFRTGTIAETSGGYFGEKKEGDLLLSAWTGRPDPTLSYALMYAGDSYFNTGKVPPPEGLMEALIASRSTNDIAERKKALSVAQRMVMENALVVPLAFRHDITVASTKVKNLQPNLLGKPKFEDVYLES